VATEVSSLKAKTRNAIAATKDADPRVREKAVFDLPRSVTDVDDAIFAVAGALRDEDIDVCRQAAVSLFTFGARTRIVIPSIMEALHHSDPIIRRAAAATLSLIGPEASAALPILRQLERDPDEQLQVWVRSALEAIGK
jgi:HEAT repeat protein